MHQPSKDDFTSLQTALHRKLINISKDIKAVRKVFPLDQEKIKDLTQARKTIDRSYSTIKKTIENKEFNPDCYNTHLKLYQSH